MIVIQNAIREFTFSKPVSVRPGSCVRETGPALSTAESRQTIALPDFTVLVGDVPKPAPRGTGFACFRCGAGASPLRVQAPGGKAAHMGIAFQNNSMYNIYEEISNDRRKQ